MDFSWLASVAKHTGRDNRSSSSPDPRAPVPVRGRQWTIHVAPLLLLTLTACASTGQGSGRLGRRLVTGKEPPAVLVSGSARCTVDGEKFQQVRISDRVWCVWEGTDKYPGPASSVTAGGGSASNDAATSRPASDEAPPRAKPTDPPARAKPHR